MSMAADISARLARDAESVCRHYLPAGHREGRYWLVGDVAGAPGRSLYVRLHGPDRGRGAAGNWTDAATGDHGDLLDLIALNRQLTIRNAIEEARHFLELPREERRDRPESPVPRGSSRAAQRLWNIALPIRGTLAERYLMGRDIIVPAQSSALRYLPKCWYRPSADDRPGTRTAWPALIAAVTDSQGHLTGVHRTWLDPAGAKASIASPRRAMGDLLAHAVRFGRPDEILAAGEGIETVLSIATALPALPTFACLSANHLAALRWPASIRRLYVARDADTSGRWATTALRDRAAAAGLDVHPLDPLGGDFNDDLRCLGLEEVRRLLMRQIDPADAQRLARELRP